MNRLDLLQQRRIITVEELEFAAKLAAWLDRREAKWMAEDMRRGRPPSTKQRDERAMWRGMVEEQAWERFYGVPTETED